MKVAALCCTHGRYHCLQRSVRCFLDQDYEGEAVMFIANSGEPLLGCFDSSYIIFDLSKPDSRESEVSCSLIERNKVYNDGKLVVNSLVSEHKNKSIVIWNMPKDSYTSVGEKYSLALDYMLNKCSCLSCNNIDIIYSHDDDDIYLPNHITEGVKGMEEAYKCGALAYKPKYSYYRSDQGIIRNENVYEPSIFVDAKYLQKVGYAPVSVKYHQQWLDPLIIDKKILILPDAPSTFIYNWGDPWPTYKMSGLGDDSEVNMYAHRRQSKDMGNGTLTPTQDNKAYYDEVKLCK